MDLLWFALEHGVPPSDVARVMNLSVEQVTRAHNDFTRKRRTTEYLRSQPIGMAKQNSNGCGRLSGKHLELAELVEQAS